MDLRTGDSFDVKVKPILESRTSITTEEWDVNARWKVTSPEGGTTVTTVEKPKTYYRTQMRYIVTNARDVPVTVDIVQGGLNSWWWWSDVRIPKESILGVQQDSDTRRWEVPVPANGKTELTATFLTPW